MGVKLYILCVWLLEEPTKFDSIKPKQLLKGIIFLFLSYTRHFPRMQNAIKSRQQSNVAQNKATSSAASTSGESDACNLVGFGPHELMSRFDLYHSTQDEHKKYVRSILESNVTHPGGQLDKLKCYIEKKVKREQLEDELLVQAADQAEQHDVSQRKPAPPPMTVPAPAGPLQDSRPLEKVR